MKPLPGTAYIEPVSRYTIFKMTFHTLEEVLPPQAYGKIQDIAADNVSGLEIGDLVAYTLAAMITFENNGVTYHVVPESQILLVLEGAEV